MVVMIQKKVLKRKRSISLLQTVEPLQRTLATKMKMKRMQSSGPVAARKQLLRNRNAQ
jgi:hypothetical protein